MNVSFDTQCYLEVPKCISLLNRSWLPDSKYKSVAGEIKSHFTGEKYLYLYLYLSIPLYLFLCLRQSLETLTGKLWKA